MKAALFVFGIVIIALFPLVTRASYITLAATSGTMYSTFDDCVPYDGGVVASGGGGCLLYFPVDIEAGETLSSVTVYYYDNSGSQYMYAYLERATLSSDSDSILDTESDSSTSASVQSKTLTYGSATSSSYTYYVKVILSNDTELRGIRIYYY